MNSHVNEPLTPRERDVALLVARGYSNRQIADELVVALSTAERHVANILSKLHMRSRAQIGVWAVQHESISSRPYVPGRRDNLPPELTSFVGRERELRELAELIPKTRLLTLIGSGGVGKSRLGLRLAGSLLEANRREVRLVELAALSDPALLPQTVASVLGLRDQRGLSMVETLVAALRTRPLLLVLDNCEPVVEACADLVSAMLLRCPEVRVLATSRIPMHLRAEITWPVDPLVTSEAVQLFVERARGVTPNFALTDRNNRAVADICVRVDGVPLAIELAAAWIRVLSPDELAARLDDSLGLLVGGARDAPERHQTLRETIAWSYRLLTADERCLLDRLSVFAGRWTLEAAEAVCADGAIQRAEVLTLLAQLVQKSLVTAGLSEGQAMRYRLLETIRQFAREHLEDRAEAESVRRRHAEHYLALAERAAAGFHGPEQVSSLDLVEQEHDNLRAALAWSVASANAEIGLRIAGAVSRFWSARGHLQEGLYWLRATQALEGGPLQARATVVSGAGWLGFLQGDLTSARRDLEASLALRRELEDAWGVADMLKNLGHVAIEANDLQSAQSFFVESLEVSRALGDQQLISFGLTGLGQVAHFGGDIATARRFYEEGLTLQRPIGQPRDIAVTLTNLAMVFSDQHDHSAARAAYAEAFELRQAVGDLAGLAHILEGLAVLAGADDDPDGAFRLVGAADNIRETIDYPRFPTDRSWLETRLSDALAIAGPDRARASLKEGRTWSLERCAAAAALPQTKAIRALAPGSPPS